MLAAAARLGAEAEVLTVTSCRREVVARGGVVREVGEVLDASAGLRLVRGGSAAYATFPVGRDADAVVDGVLCLLEWLPEADPLDEPDGVSVGLPCEPLLPLEDFKGLTAAGSRCEVTGAEVELRTMQEIRQVEFATSSGLRAKYETSGATALLRATVSAPSGVGHAQYTEHAPNAAALLAGAHALRETAIQTAETLANAPRQPPRLPEVVVFDPQIAAQLILLLVRSFEGDAVLQGRSRIAERFGDALAASWFTLSDDPSDRTVPFAADFDDEGSRTTRRVLVDGGRVAAFIGDRRFAPQLQGVVPGSGWRRGAPAPRPRAASLTLEPAPTGEVKEAMSYLRILQSYGLHMANPVTGDFSMGASGAVVHDGVVTGVTGLTVADNIFDLLPRLWPSTGGSGRAQPGGVFITTPALGVEGIPVGM